MGLRSTSLVPISISTIFVSRKTVPLLAADPSGFLTTSVNVFVPNLPGLTLSVTVKLSAFCVCVCAPPDAPKFPLADARSGASVPASGARSAAQSRTPIPTMASTRINQSIWSDLPFDQLLPVRRGRATTSPDGVLTAKPADCLRHWHDMGEVPDERKFAIPGCW